MKFILSLSLFFISISMRVEILPALAEASAGRSRFNGGFLT
jgi:hypothetical protein